MSTNAEIIRKLYADFQQAGIDAILAVCTEDTTWAIPGAPALLYAGHNPTGPGAFQSTWTHRWRLSLGKVRELHDHVDTLAVAKALGRG
jgi:ketosteroid isomerase-like protein